MSKSNREVNRAAWAEKVAEFNRSGLSVPKWCEAHGVKVHQLRYWLKNLRQRRRFKELSSGYPWNIMLPSPS